MTDKFYFRPVIPLLLSMIIGIISGSCFPGYRTWTYPPIFACLLFILYIIQKRQTAFLSPLILFVGLGYLSIQSWMAPEFPPNHIIHFTDTHPWKIIGTIDRTPEKIGTRLRFILRVETLKNNDKPFPAFGKIRVTASENIPEISRGDRVAVFSKIRSIRNFCNPGGFDYKRYMAFKNVWGTAYVSGKTFSVLEKNPGKGVCRMIENARGIISGLIENSVPEKGQQGLLKALIIGDKNAVLPDLREAFNRTGIGHLLAISGLHIGIVATAVFLFFQWLLSHFYVFLHHAWTQKGAAVLSVVPVFIYGLLSGMSPSTQRAVIMVSIFLMTFLFEREQDLMNTLALAAILIIVVHPTSLFSISFQLSFTAVFTILYGMSRVQASWMSDKNGITKARRLQLFKKLFYFFLASFFAILGTLPLVMFYFNQISLIGLLTNFLIVPLIGFIVIPLGLFAVFLLPVTRLGASLCLDACAAVLSPALDIVSFFSELPFASVKTFTPTVLEISCYYALFWAVLNMLPIRPERCLGPDTQNTEEIEQREKYEEEAKKAAGNRKFAKILLGIVIFSLGIDALYWLNQRFWHDDLKVTIIDVGQGTSALLEIPGGDCLLIDGGGFSDNSIFDVGEKIIAPLLWRKKIKTVDTLILSHPNSDHLNGLTYIAKHFNVKSVWSNTEEASTLSYQKFRQTIKQKKIALPGIDDISGPHNMNGVILKVLYPPRNFKQRSATERWRSMNNNSLVIKVAFGSKSILFPGDIKKSAEKELVARAGDDIGSTVLISPHHGSKTSSTGSFLDRVKPELVIISAGWKNRFRFPHTSVLKRYRSRGYRIFRTDKHGAMILSTDGQALTIRPTIIDNES